MLRIADTKQLGEHVLVQGGTFLNDAILRAFELYIGKDVIRPDIAGLMGAYGAALIARERTTAQTPELDLSAKALDLSDVKTTEFRCKSCNNHCLLTLHRFASGQKHVSGNRCDFALKSVEGKNAEHFIDKKCALLFNREPLAEDKAPRGTRRYFSPRGEHEQFAWLEKAAVNFLSPGSFASPINKQRSQRLPASKK